jgi:hypothetical protein
MARAKLVLLNGSVSEQMEPLWRQLQTVMTMICCQSSENRKLAMNVRSPGRASSVRRTVNRDVFEVDDRRLKSRKASIDIEGLHNESRGDGIMKEQDLALPCLLQTNCWGVKCITDRLKKTVCQETH